MTMKLTLDPKSPVPLYHQIAEAVRYRIATGKLAHGERLPPVREAAGLFGVNLHTVRRAYRALADEGIVDSRNGAGTRVRAAPRLSSERAAGLERFLAKTVAEAREKHGLSAADLARILADPPAARSAGVVHVVECSESQCRDHAREIEERFAVRAEPWPLDRGEELPPGPVVATYFHYNDVRRLWPRRLEDVHFVAIHADPAIADDPRLKPEPGRRRAIDLCELDEPKAQNIAADLSVLFPEDAFRIRPRVAADPGRLLRERGPKTPLLLPPRVFALLSPEERLDRRVVHVRYVIARDELERLGERLALPPRRA